VKNMTFRIAALFAAAIAAAPLSAGAQGYPGVVTPQAGYRAPANGGQQGGGGAMPFTAGDTKQGGGYAGVTQTPKAGGAAAESGDGWYASEGGDSGWYASEGGETGWYDAGEGAPAEEEETGDADSRNFASYFSQMEETATTPEEKRIAHMKRIEAQQKRQQAEVQRANRERLKKTEAWMQNKVEEERARDYEAYLRAQQEVLGDPQPATEN
jgi:hypothetical protein